MPAPLPIACTLSPAELRTNRDALLPGLAAHALARTTLPSGMRLRFSATAERLRQIAAVAQRETTCCAFLDFHVGMSLGDASLTLDVTGPPGTARFLEELLDTKLAA